MCLQSTPSAQGPSTTIITAEGRLKELPNAQSSLVYDPTESCLSHPYLGTIRFLELYENIDYAIYSGTIMSK